MWSRFITASVDTRKHWVPGVAGERCKPVCSVDRASVSHSYFSKYGCDDAAFFPFPLVLFRVYS